MVLLTETTDWVIALAAVAQVLITGVGFWLLYTTFVLQAKVATDQQKMLEIETRRARREIRPIFKVISIYDGRIPGFTTFEFQCESNDAYNLEVKDRSGKYIRSREPHTKIPSVNKGDKLSYSYDLSMPIMFIDLKQPEFRIAIELTFEDVDGFRYKQLIEGEHCDLDAKQPFLFNDIH